MSRPRPIMSNVRDQFFFLIFVFVVINVLGVTNNTNYRMNTDTPVLLFICERISYYFWMITWMKNVNNF